MASRFIDLVGVDQEILAQHRQLAGGARLLEVVDTALEELRSVSTDRQARAVFGITLGDVGRHEISAQHALAKGWPS
jgi:hypothetical protein